MTFTSLVRALLAGTATGSRSMSVLAACALTEPARSTTPAGRADAVLHRGPVPRLAAAAALGELVGDQLPKAPPRTAPQALVPRLVLGAATAGILAERRGESVPVAAVVGVLAAAGASFAGVRGRAAATARFGNDRPGAVIEDVAALGLAGVAARLP